MRVCCRYDALPNVHLTGQDWEKYIRMNVNARGSTLEDHPQLKDRVAMAKHGVIWGKTAVAPASDDALEETEDEQHVFKGNAMDGFKPGNTGFIRQAQLIQWPCNVVYVHVD